ncbi:hypothetical protein ACUY4R_001626 [Kosakonia sp. BK9b]|uniref:hypothetical protein n=1 Tax=Kosakonia sp. TaxID=1916651 RepID=UPI0028A2CDCE|nr:hypothetical protein [Kosakonia sp.]
MDKYVENLNGFMDALGTMNRDINRGSHYFMVKLEEGDTLRAAVAEYHRQQSEKHPPEYWHPVFSETTWQHSERVAAAWFFEHSAMTTLPENIKSNLLADFHDKINEMMGKFRVFELITTPPVWYASNWDEFVFDSQYGRFLLHFSCYD